MLIFYENRASQGQVQGAREAGQDILVAVILEVTGTLGMASDPWVAKAGRQLWGWTTTPWCLPREDAVQPSVVPKGLH